MHHIRECLPEIKSKIGQQLQKYRAELQEIGDPLDEDEGMLVSFFYFLFYFFFFFLFLFFLFLFLFSFSYFHIFSFFFFFFFF